MLKNVYFPLLVFLLPLIIGCGSSGSREGGTHRHLDIESVMDEFVNCRRNNEQPHDCKWQIAKAICGHFEINDLVDENAPGGYIPYDEIEDFVSQSPDWEKLGSADDQTVLNEAAENSGQGIATIAFKAGSSFNNVAIILNGNMIASSSWGLKCPLSSVFFPNKPGDSFVGKGLNYAWSSPEDVVLYSRTH